MKLHYITSHSAIKTANLHVKNDETGKEYILVKSARPDKSVYRISVFDEMSLPLLLNKTLSVNHVGYLIDSCNHEKVMTLYNNEKVNNCNLSIDHINRIPHDNRIANLRLATRKQQHFNKGLRSDRREVIENLPHELDALPRFVRWDHTEKKYTFKDHPLAKFAVKRNIPINVSGTKSESATLSEKMYDCLENILDMFGVIRQTDHEFDIDGISALRLQLGREYNDLVAFAHRYDPQNFPPRQSDFVDLFALSNYSYEEEYYQSFLEALPKPNRVYHGPRCHQKSHMTLPEQGAGLCKKDVLFMWDMKHHDVMMSINIDVADYRIHITPDLKAKFPQLKNSGRCILCQDFIYHVLEGHPWKEKHRVININQIREDLRTCNLLEIPADDPKKCFKTPSTHKPILSDVSLGEMKYLPRGVTTVNYAKDPENKFEVHVRPLSSYIDMSGHPPSYKENKPSKIVMSRHNAAQLFKDRVIPILEKASEDFHEKNRVYQDLLDSYYMGVEQLNNND